MEASSVCNQSIVPNVLDDSNYNSWSSCMEDYLLSRDLWDVVMEPVPELEVSEEMGSSESSKGERKKKNIIKRWRKKNASALHAIKLSCGPYFLPKIVKLKSSNEAWKSLAVAAQGSGSGYSKVEHKRNPPNYSPGSVPEYKEFIEATMKRQWDNVKEMIIRDKKLVCAKVFPEQGTILHYVLGERQENYEMAMWLVVHMKAEELEIQDQNDYTPLAIGAKHCDHRMLPVLTHMVAKNEKTPLQATDDILTATQNKVNASLFINFIQMDNFGIAEKVVEEFPRILVHQDFEGTYALQALAKVIHAFSTVRRRELIPSTYDMWTYSLEENILRSEVVEDMVNKLVTELMIAVRVRIMKYLQGSRETHKMFFDKRNEAFSFLLSMCIRLQNFQIQELVENVYPTIIDAAKLGYFDFINEMVRANPVLLYANIENKSIFWHAVHNRHEKIFSLIYGSPSDRKEELLSGYDDKGNNILHLAARLASREVLHRTSSIPALQMQRELLWFKEVWSVCKPSYREDLNRDGLTPLQLFSQTHASMIIAGEKLIKETATSSTVVGALILTIMFAAVFTVPGGINQDTGHPLFANKILFKIFIIFDVLSLSSSTTSILVFLTILANNYVEDDFLLDLPRRLMVGVLTLYLSIATMMVTFCLALVLMLDEGLHFILYVSLVTSVPVLLFSSSMLPLLVKISRSTFGSSIFNRNTKLPRASYRQVEEVIVVHETV